MSKIKPALPKGTRDFGPEVLAKRNHIVDTIKEVYHLYGFVPIETPTMELLSTLMGKYGDEGDQLLFKIINSGDYLSKADDQALADKSSRGLLKSISNKGLRYDLTVPFARFVAMHRNDIAFPFKRYQIQSVWRADRPQKGRYREFVQCDADIIGSNSLLNEVELLGILTEVFDRLKLKSEIEIKLNNRKILEGISEAIGAKDQFGDLAVAIDKLDKIGMEKVLDELRSKAFSEDSLEKLSAFLSFNGDYKEVLSFLKEDLANVSTLAAEGIQEMEAIFDLLEEPERYTIDLTLARGLNYYTGTIIEVVPINVKMGSISGGGRYDNLIDVFGMPDVSGVGFSFGLDRIYDTMDELNLFEGVETRKSQVLFIAFDDECMKFNLDKVRALRRENISAEIFPDLANSGGKLKKQMKYANRLQFTYVIVTGKDEMNKNVLNVKDLESGEQANRSMDELLELLKK